MSSKESTEKRGDLARAIKLQSPRQWPIALHQWQDTSSSRFSNLLTGLHNTSCWHTTCVSVFCAIKGHSVYCRQENTLDLLGADHLVLSRLMYTLGIITYAALHAPVSHACKHMLLCLDARTRNWNPHLPSGVIVLHGTLIFSSHRL